MRLNSSWFSYWIQNRVNYGSNAKSDMKNCHRIVICKIRFKRTLLRSSHHLSFFHFSFVPISFGFGIPFSKHYPIPKDSKKVKTERKIPDEFLVLPSIQSNLGNLEHRAAEKALVNNVHTYYLHSIGPYIGIHYTCQNGFTKCKNVAPR